MKAKPTKDKFFDISEKKAKKLSFILGGVLLLLILLIALFPLLDGEQKKHEVTTYSMGSYVQQTVYGSAREEAAAEAANAVQALENKISWRVAGSEILSLNGQAGKQWMTLSEETFAVLSVAQDVAEKSGGAFDATIAPLSRLWDFDNERHAVPDTETIDEMRKNVGYTNLRLDAEDRSASLKYSGNAVDLGAMGKGAACDAAIAIYAEKDVRAAIVSVGGSVGVYGQKPGGALWNIAVRDPHSTGTLGSVSVQSGFLSTSGSYEKFFTENGRTYHHLLDPKTGYPAESGLISVTVLSDGGALSDALSTACFVLGLEDGLVLLEQYGAEGIFIDENNVITVTDGLKSSFTLTAEGYALAEPLH